jgi:hypothetical protein
MPGRHTLTPLGPESLVGLEKFEVVPKGLVSRCVNSHPNRPLTPAGTVSNALRGKGARPLRPAIELLIPRPTADPSIGPALGLLDVDERIECALCTIGPGFGLAS